MPKPKIRYAVGTISKFESENDFYLGNLLLLFKPPELENELKFFDLVRIEFNFSGAKIIKPEEIFLIEINDELIYPKN